jgi:hypothetical protein
LKAAGWGVVVETFRQKLGALEELKPALLHRAFAGEL